MYNSDLIEYFSLAKDYVEKRIKSLRRKSISEAKSPLHNENHIFEQLKNLKPTKKNTPMQFPKEINLRTDASKKVFIIRQISVRKNL